MKRLWILAPVLLLVSGPFAAAEVDCGPIEYAHGEVELEGFIARPKGLTGKAPGVLLVHAWRGHGENIQTKAKELAEKGYVAFALDMYGKGVLAKNNDEARQLAMPFYVDPRLMRDRALAGLEILKGQPDVDPKRIAAIGFCFGGTTVLEMARDGADIAGVVSFHGALKTKQPADPGGIKAKVFVAHGADEQFVPPEELLGFWKEMQAAKADYQVLILSDAVHAFTDPGAGDDPSTGVAYNKSAHERSWQAMYRFFGELF